MIRLHHVPFARSFRVLWMLEELGLDYQVQNYSIRDGSLRDPAFLAINPTGRVPALEIDQQVWTESGAILQLLAERHPGAGFGCAAGSPERAAYLAHFGFGETMASIIEQLNLNHVFLRDPAMASPVVIKLNTRRLQALLGTLEQMLQGRSYLLDQGFSAADMMMGFNLWAAPYYVRLDEYPGLQAYRARLQERPAFQAAQAKDGPQDFYDREFYPVPEAG